MEETVNNNKGTLIQIPIEDEVKQAFIDYSMSVITSRAVPDVRDGLKPVHRRIIYDMNKQATYWVIFIRTAMHLFMMLLCA